MSGKKAVFIDRDGVIIRQVDFLMDVKNVRLISGAADAIRYFNRAGYLVIVHSNQPVIARGLITEEGMAAMNRAIGERLAKRGATVDAWYICPHHPKATLKKYRMRCGCRKPGAGMLRRAARDHGIDLKRSWTVGDGVIDIVAGKRAGTKTILVKSGPGHARLDKLYDAKPDFTVKNLRAAARIITTGIR